MARKAKAKITKQIEEEVSAPLYSKGDCVVLYDSTYPDSFTLGVIAKDVQDRDQELTANICLRSSKKINFFYEAFEQADLKVSDILGFIKPSSVQKKKEVSVVSPAGDSYSSFHELSLAIGEYRKLKVQAEAKAKDVEGLDQDLPSEEEEESEENTQEHPSSKKAVRKITRGSKSRAESKRGSRKRRESDATQSAQDSKITKGANSTQPDFPNGYKRGKYNSSVQVKDFFEQLENPSQVPNLDGAVANNNRELIRAVNIGNLKLVKNILGSKKKISRLTQRWGIENITSPILLAIQKKETEILKLLLTELSLINEGKGNVQYARDQPDGFYSVDTGFNDKYAYGVQTRAVHMGRGNKQGYTAFTQDVNPGNNIYDVADVIFKSSEYSVDDIKNIISYFPTLENTFTSKIELAVMAGDHKKAGYLIEMNMKKDSWTFGEFHKKALLGTTDRSLKDMTKRNTTKQAQLSSKFGPMHAACINPNIDIMKKIFELNDDFNFKDGLGRKPVHYTACSSSTANLEFLITNRVDTRDIDGFKKTPLMYAAENGRIDNVNLLVTPGRSILAAKDKFAWSAIHFAAQGGHNDCLKAIVDAGVNINLTGPERKTALHIAAAKGNLEMVEFLIQNNCSRTSKDKFGRTALILAVMNGNLKVASILLRWGALFDLPDSSKNYPLHYACGYGYPEMISLLIEAGAEVNTLNSWNMSPTVVALLKNYFECVKCMLEYDLTDVNGVDNDGRTLLSNSVKMMSDSNYDKFMFLLVDKKADPNLVDINGLSTLHHICRMNKDMVRNQIYGSAQKVSDSELEKQQNKAHKIIQKYLRALLNNKADINQQTKDGLTPYHLALINKNQAAIEVLLESPALSLNMLTKDNKSIFHYLIDLASTEDFFEIYRATLSKTVRVGELLNLPNNAGWNPFLSLIKEMTKTDWYLHYRTLLTTALQKKIKESYEKKEAAKMDEENNDKLLGGARTKMTSRKAVKKSWAGGKGFGQNQEDSASSFAITEQDQEKINKKALQQEEAKIMQFVDLLGELVKHGAQPSQTVIKKVIVEEEEKDEDNYQILNFGISYPNKSKNKKANSEIDRTYLGFNALHLACQGKFADIIKFFIEEVKMPLNILTETKKNEIYIYTESHPCAISCDQTIIEYLIQKGADPSIQNEDNDLPIILAAKSKNLDLVNQLMSKGCNVDVCNKKGSTPLLEIIKSRDLSLIQRIIEIGADINFCDNKGRNCLHWAVNNANSNADASNEIENYLLSNGVDYNKLDIRSRTPLHYAFVKIGSPFLTSQIDPIETVSNILSKPSVLHSHADAWLSTPLHYASSRGATISTLYLLRHGASASLLDSSCNSALSLALLHGHQSVAIILLQNNVPVDQGVHVVENKITPENEEKHPQQTTECSEDPQEDSQEDSSESWEGTHGDSEESEETMKGRKVIENKRHNWRNNNWGFQEEKEEVTHYNDLKELVGQKVSTFMVAIKRNWQGVAFLLLECGFNLGLAILDCFNSQKFNYVYTILIKKGDSDIYTMRNEQEQNIAHLFCKFSNKFTCNLLYTKIYTKLKEKAIDFSLVDKDGKNCLHYAAESGKLSLIKELLEMGIPINKPDHNGDVALSLLAKNCYSNLKEFFEIAKPFKLNINAEFPYNERMHTVATYTVLTQNTSSLINHIEVLKKAGADLNIGDSSGVTPLMYIVKGNNAAQVKQFVNEIHSDTTPVDRSGKTVIHHVVQPLEFGYYQNIEILEFLAPLCPLNQKDNLGMSPYELALSLNSQVMAKILVKYGAKAEIDEEKGIRKVQTSLLNQEDFPQVQFDYLEDFENYIAKMNEQELTKPIIEKEKPSHHVKGTVEVVYENEEPFSCFLVKVEIHRGFYSGNLFYKMQILREMVRDVYIVFTQWGRNGTNGQYQQTPFGTLSEAKEEFCKIFKQKSGNDWDKKEDFKKIPKKYRLLEIKAKANYKDLIKPINYKDPKLPVSELSKPLYKFIRRICNAQILKKVSSRNNIDSQSLPLYNLNRERLNDAKLLLDRIELLVIEGDKRRSQNLGFKEETAEEISSLSNEYYELIPTTEYQESALPPLTNLHTLSKHKKILSDLMYAETVVQLLMASQLRIDKVHPVDYCFNSLNFKMFRLSDSTSEYSLIKKYIKRGQSSRISKDFIASIYAIERRDERDNIQKWDEYGNKMLLWHGTKQENIVGILQTGFRICPPGVSHTGSMFGDGVYFADQFQKSYGYTHNYNYYYNNYSNKRKKEKRYMMLCEVALGNMKILKEAKQITHIPNEKFQSVMGEGKYQPNFNKSIYLSNGCVVPLGPLIDAKPTEAYTSLNYNEYIIYDTTQIRVKYVLELRNSN